MAAMFGLTLPKILIAAIVIWFVWRLLNRPSVSDRSSGNERPPGPKSTGAGRNERPAEREIEDMVQCPKCGAYVPSKGGHSCGSGAGRG
jgi:hypothetical protein